MPKKKSHKVARTAVSLAPDLLRRMRATKDVNWSAIAAQAFEAELARINLRKVDVKMEDVIERLRASRREGVSALFNNGFTDGQEWAKYAAAEIELRRLEKARRTAKAQMNDGYNNWLTGLIDKPNLSPRAAFFYCISPSDYNILHDEAVEDFWAEALEEGFAPDSKDSEYVHGFADGALSIWEQVANKL